MHKKLVLFDIDGTLLFSTNSTLRNRFTHAMEKTYGTSHPIDWEYIEGHTDTTVFLHTLQKKGLTREEIIMKLPEAMEVTYEHFSNNVPETYKETRLPGAIELLEILSKQVTLGVLTGNYEKIAWLKLELVGLKDYFSFGLFGHEAEDRPALARLVHTKAKKQLHQDFDSTNIYFIGDTPKDIACAREINAHIISVTTGKYKAEELQKYNPDLLVNNLTNPTITEYILGKIV